VATTPVPPVPAGFDWHLLIPLFETAGNVAALIAPGGAAFLPLIQAGESALNPILLKIGSGTKPTIEDITTDVMGFYGMEIAALALFKQKLGLTPQQVTEVQTYITEIQDAMATWIRLGKAMDPSIFTVSITPIVVPA